MNNKEKLRKITIKTRVTKKEYDQFLSDCDLFQKSQSELIRWALFHKEVVFKMQTTNSVSDEKLKDYILSLNRIGTNINQIARYLNEGGSLTTSILQEIHKLNTSVLQINAEISEQKITKFETDEAVYELK